MVSSWHYPPFPYLDKTDLRFNADGTFRFYGIKKQIRKILRILILRPDIDFSE